MSFVVDVTSRARLLITGADGPAFLHRMSTQHVSGLTAGEGRLNVLTNDKGRIVDVVHHVVVAEGVLLLGHALDTDGLSAWLDRYFFTENLELVPVPGAARLVDVDTAEALVVGAKGLDRWQMVRNEAVVVVRTFDRVEGPECVAAFVVVALDGSALPAADSSVDVDVARAIAAGTPTTEMSDAHTPLDLELHDAIHWAKGCYIGQEVIARLDTYGKQRKAHYALSADVDLPVGSAVKVEEKAVGMVTSSTSSPLSGEARALAVLKLNEATTTALASSPDGVAVQVVTAAGDVVAKVRRRRQQQQPHD